MEAWRDELYHYGTKGQKWGVRRYQNEDGSLTLAGKARYGKPMTKKEHQKYADQSRDTAISSIKKYVGAAIGNGFLLGATSIGSNALAYAGAAAAAGAMSVVGGVAVIGLGAYGTYQLGKSIVNGARWAKHDKEAHRDDDDE